MKVKRVAFTSVLFAVILGCVVIPNTFDAHIVVEVRHSIEKQADDLLDFVEGKSDTLPGLDESEPAEKSSWLDRGRELLSPISVVYAEELKTSSPRISQIATKLRERNAALEELKKTGCIGEDNHGYVSVRPSKVLADAKKKNEIQQITAEENKDRKALYNEISRLNKEQNVTVATVERIYAQQRLKRAKPGEIFQLPPKGEDFDAFKASPLGEKLGDECVPEGWVTIK